MLEILGYVASALILISLIMNSIIKLRWINLLGATIFAVYGFLIGSIPVGVMNTAIVIVNTYYLYKIYTSKEYFRKIEIRLDSEYVLNFLDFYKKDINKYFEDFDYKKLNGEEVSFFVLRDLVPAGFFIAKKYNESSLFIELDYVIPKYRDFKIGKYIFDLNREYFLKKKINKIYSCSTNDLHDKYLEKMGFIRTKENNKDLLVRYIK